MTHDRERSILDRLRNEARARNEDFQVVLARFGVERLLYRLSVSPHSDAFVLKGAQLIQARAGERYRPTRDLDLLGLGRHDEASIRTVFVDLCESNADGEAMVFDGAAIRIETIRETMGEHGVRIRLAALPGRTRIPIQVDVGFGDVITPGPVPIVFPALLHMPRPQLKAYPLESVVAEKFEALASIGVFTSRVKDIYDLWKIKNLFDLDPMAVRTAMERTFERRGTALDNRPDPLSSAFFSDPVKVDLWQSFVDRTTAVAPPLCVVCEELSGWLSQILGEQQ